MPRNVTSGIQNNFLGGYITQATALKSPENAAFDQDNVVFSERGIVGRRFGMDFENNFIKKTLSNTEKAQVTYHWKNAAGDGNTNFVAQQNGGLLYFYDTSTTLSLSGGINTNTLDLNSFKASGATQANLDQNECQFSTGLGYLFVVHPYCDPFYVLYNPSGGTFTASIITVTIRDLVGITETVLVDNRPSSLTDVHNYNLLNQGWDAAKTATMHSALSTTYPSNADVWWIFKDSTDVFSPSTTLASNSRGSTPAPKGFFRLNPWSTARAAIALAQTGTSLTLSAVDETTNGIRPSVTEFHSGRVFYSGVNAMGYNSRVYFSKIVQQPSDFGSCMTDNDPTSESVFDFLPSDGGIISIPQAGTIYRLISLGPTLLVFGANGVWAITGSVGIGFSATDYSVNPVSYTRSISGCSFVVVDGSVIWWNATGINIVSQGKDGLVVQSLSDETIKDYYLDIDSTSKRFARGAYNPRTHVVQWLFRSASSSGISESYTFDTALSFNTLIKAFYTWSLPTDNVQMNSIVVIEGSGSIIGSENVIDNTATQVVDNLSNNVVTYGFARTSATTVTKYLVYYSGGFTFAENFNVNYFDWVQFDGTGEDYSSFFTTWPLVKTQGERKFQSNYVFVFSDLEDTNSYDFQARWDYSNNRSSGRWTQKQRVTHSEFTNYDAGRRKLKVRGTGKALQLSFKSVSGLPFNIVGWSTYDTASAAP